MNSEELIDRVFPHFKQILSNRSNLLTEDNIRYYLFFSMAHIDDCLTELNLDNFILELPYRSKTSSYWDDDVLITKNINKELDMFYKSNKNDECFAFEIKYHKKTKSAFPHTDAAGAIFNDLKRLSFIKENKIKKYFLYVTDSEMDKYLGNPPLNSNSYRRFLSSFYNLENDNTIKLNLSSKNIDIPLTFWRSANDSYSEKYKNFINIEVKSVYKEKIITKNNLPLNILVYEVK